MGSGEKRFRHGAHRHKCHKASNKKKWVGFNWGWEKGIARAEGRRE